MYRVVPGLPAYNLAPNSYIRFRNVPLDDVPQFIKMYGIVENISSFDTHSERESI